MAELNIPADHWDFLRAYQRDAYISNWERRLRERIANEPDPALRFDGWLRNLISGEWEPGLKLIFVEQPWLGRAQLVKQLVDKTEARTRQQIASEVAAGPDAYR